MIGIDVLKPELHSIELYAIQFFSTIHRIAKVILTSNINIMTLTSTSFENLKNFYGNQVKMI